jgi:hypothetical protein
VEVGIDNLEHGFQVNTELDPGKQPDTCSDSGGDYTLEHMSPGSPEANQLIALLVKHHVAITSTLAGLAASLPAPGTSVDGGPPLRSAVLQAMTPAAREAFLYDRSRPRSSANGALLLRRDMDLQRAFSGSINRRGSVRVASHELRPAICLESNSIAKSDLKLGSRSGSAQLAT